MCLCALTAAPAAIIHVPADQPTIQAGINAAADGDTVLVADGTYFENINYSGKAITVASHFILDQKTSHINNTIISAPKDMDSTHGSIVSFVTGETTESVLMGFTITGGTGTVVDSGRKGGGGIFIDRASPTIAYNIVCQNNVENDQDGYTMGGGICITMSNHEEFTILENNTVKTNTITATEKSVYGGGIFVGANARILSNRIEDNKVYYTGTTKSFIKPVATGGGLCCKSEPIDAFIDVVIIGNVVQNNYVESTHAAFVGGVDLMVTNTVFTDNVVKENVIRGQARNNIPGMRVINRADSLFIARNIFSANKSKGGAFCWGGGLSIIFLKGGVVRDNVFERNETDNGGGLTLTETNKVEVSKNQFTGNISAADAAGLFLQQCKNIRIFDNVWEKNVAENNGGGCLINASKVLMFNNLFIENESKSGGGVSAIDGANVQLINNSFSGNKALHDGGSALFVNGSNVKMFNTICWDDTSGSDEINIIGASEVIATYSDIKGGYEGQGNIDLEPAFRDSFLQLASGSPCIGTGKNECEFGDVTLACPSTDFKGAARPQPTGSNPDIGAVESELGTKVDLFPDERIRPETVQLQRNYPNPFNPSTIIEYDVPSSQHVQLVIYDLLGRHIRTLTDTHHKAGRYGITWNAVDDHGKAAPAGVYLCRLQSGDVSRTIKMVLVR